MQRPQSETVALNDILITEELYKRSPRPPNLLSENQALHTLAQQLVNQPETMLPTLVDMTIDLCIAGTAGVSLLETTSNGEEVFRWNVLAGTLAQYVGGTTPRNFSPCGVCLDRSAPVLFSHPERYFTDFQAVNTPVIEGLFLPIIAENCAFGTIWIMSHDQQRHFDAEDVRVLTSLANFTAAFLLLNQRKSRELLDANAALEAEIVERKRAQAESREAQRRLELSLTGANLGAWTYNIVTDEFWADDRAKLMHGYEPHEVHTLAEAGANIYPEDRDRAQAAIAQAIQDRLKLQTEYRVICKDGNVRWIASHAEFMPTGNQDEGMFYGVAQDISDRKQAEADRIQLIREQANRLEAERMSQMKDEFLAMVSHELQSPLVAILGWTRLLRANPPAPAMLMKHLETIERNATLQAKLIQDLLDISRISAGKLRLRLEPVELESAIETAIAAVEAAAIMKNISLQHPSTDRAVASVLVMGDCDRLQQVFCNLLTNAIKFTSEGGSVTIELSTIKAEKPKSAPIAEIQFVDTGIGISEDFLPHVFDRFHQAEKSGSAGGLGLGLAIALHIVELHSGTIHATSEGVGQGATFIVKLPLRQVKS